MELTEMIKQAANSLFDEIVSIRRALHRRPELSFQEYETAAYICRYLKDVYKRQRQVIRTTKEGTKPAPVFS